MKSKRRTRPTHSSSSKRRIKCISKIIYTHSSHSRISKQGLFKTHSRHPFKINDYKYAITIVTNITASTDQAITKSIHNQKSYYASLGYESLFFIECNHLGIDIDGQSLVLWKKEIQALTSQKADIHLKNFLKQLEELEDLQRY